jgi:hypothetical protein
MSPLARNDGVLAVSRERFNHRATGSLSAIALRRILDSDSTEYGF